MNVTNKQLIRIIEITEPRLVSFGVPSYQGLAAPDLAELRRLAIAALTQQIKRYHPEAPAGTGEK